jgi:hypothetical protein
MLRQSAQAESFMTSVERLSYFASRLPREEAPRASALADGDADAPAGPSAANTRVGGIEFREVVVRYRPDLPVVLRSVSVPPVKFELATS